MTVLKSTDKKSPELDDVLIKFNLFGRYHAKNLLLISLAYWSNSMYCSNFVFVAEEVQYSSRTRPLLSQTVLGSDVSSDVQFRSHLENKVKLASKKLSVLNRAKRYFTPAQTLLHYKLCADERFANDSCAGLGNSSDVCTEWVYEDPHSFVAEFQLACHEWKRTLVGTVHSLGYMIGLLVVGPLSDRVGRKKVIAVTGMLGGVLGVARSFSASYWLYVALEFLEAALGDCCSPVFMLTIEMVANEKRLIFQMLCSYGFTLGAMSLPLWAWMFPYWRNLLRVIYTPAIFFFVYLFVLDESPRWLLTKGRREEAVTILEKAAKKNKLKLDKNVIDNLKCEETKGVSFIVLLRDTFSSGALLKRFFICLIWWTTSTFVNYGMQINSVSLQGNKYVNFALISVVDIPGSLIITYLLIRFKRKIPLLFSFIFAAILCLCQPFVPTNMPLLSVLLFMVGKLMSSAYFGITYMFTSEIFPTYTRNSMHALCSSLGRIGSIIAPQTPLLMIYWKGLPSVVFGAASLLAGLATLFAPDTADDSLPDTVRQAEALGKHAP